MRSFLKCFHNSQVIKVCENCISQMGLPTLLGHPRYSSFLLLLMCVSRSVVTNCDPRDCSHQAPLFMGFSRQEYWSGLPFPSPGDLPDLGMELESPAMQADSLPSDSPEKPYIFSKQLKHKFSVPVNILSLNQDCEKCSSCWKHLHILLLVAYQGDKCGAHYS